MVTQDSWNLQQKLLLPVKYCSLGKINGTCKIASQSPTENANHGEHILAFESLPKTISKGQNTTIFGIFILVMIPLLLSSQQRIMVHVVEERRQCRHGSLLMNYALAFCTCKSFQHHYNRYLLETSWLPPFMACFRTQNNESGSSKSAIFTS